MDVKTLCLGVLSERPMTGYEIRKLFEVGFNHFFLAGFGSIYPALAELAGAGLVTVESVEQAKRPDKKVYRITAAGRDALVAELSAAEPHHKVRSEFLVLLYFAHLLPPERLAEVLDGMVREWRRGLAEDFARAERELAGRMTPGMRTVIEFGRTMVGTAADFVERNRDALLATHAAPPPPPAAQEAAAE
jgi:DNA-binding PadR family transcriptional regulator